MKNQTQEQKVIDLMDDSIGRSLLIQSGYHNGENIVIETINITMSDYQPTLLVNASDLALYTGLAFNKGHHFNNIQKEILYRYIEEGNDFIIVQDSPLEILGNVFNSFKKIF